MAGQPGLSRAATERLTFAPWAPNGRAGTALAGLASASLLLLLSLGVWLHGGPFPGARAHAGVVSHASGQALAAAFSQALGAGNGAYHARPSLGGYEIRNPAQRLRARFGEGSVVFSSGSLRVALALRGSGYGPAMRPVAASAPRATSNRVAYAHGSLIEWYENGPLGVEQGFTVEHAPADAAGQLTLAIGVSGNARPRLHPGSGGVTFARDGHGSLRYGGLFAIDARGHTLPSNLSLRGSTLLLRVDTRGAAYPLRLDPLVQQGEKLTGGTTEGEAGLFGFAVALSSDGNTALVGAQHDANEAGAAWVFARSGTAWSQQGPKLVGAGEVGEGHFGRSVALSGDGDTALIGGPADGNHVGAAWIFQRSGSAWTQQGAKLVAGQEAGAYAHFGRAVALSGDGATALVSAPNDGNGRGSVWVLKRVGGEWVQHGAKLTGAEMVGEAHLGAALAMSQDGATAMAGGPGDDGRLGAAWAFVRGADAWTQQGPKLTGAEAVGGGSGSCLEEAGEEGEDAGCGFGRSVALSATGDTALIGGPRDGDRIGAAWAFQRSGSSWTQQGPKLTATGEVGQGEFGYSAALSADGDTALIGGPGDNARVGGVWVISRAGGTWIQQVHKLKPKGEQGKAGFGYSVALSADAETALVGAPFERTKLGAAWAFVQGAEVENPIEEKPKKRGKEATGESSPAPSAEAPTGTGVAASPRSGVLAFSSTGASCRLARVSRNIAVLSPGRLTLKLLWSGRGRCSGRLTLTAGVRRRGARPKTLTIARATFSLPAGRSGLVRTRLNSRGRGLLSASHGRLSARLAAVTVVAGRARSSSASVRLSVAQKRGVRLIGH